MKNNTSFKWLGGMLLATALQYFPPACGQSHGSKTDLTVHEWGTFTSVQGADGEQMNWYPLGTSDLPDFVYNMYRPASITNRYNLDIMFGKGNLLAKQRMETPVIYFYSTKDQEVNVQVNFPGGTMTEWYPEATDWRPIKYPTTSTHQRSPEGLLLWSNLTVLGKERSIKHAAGMPGGVDGSHYYAARNVDANVIQTKNAAGREEHEKFLFYRGVAQFEAPLKVSLSPESRYLLLENIGPEPLHNLIVLNIDGSEVGHLKIGLLKPQGKREIPWSEIERARGALAPLQSAVSINLEKGLTGQGLFQKEATAMIQTWHDSWLAEQGLRVLYILPKPWANRTLPLQVTPSPSQVERVMVGRAEVITPQREWKLMQQLVQYSSGDEVAKLAAIKECLTLGMGRFTEPALRRVVGKNPSPELNKIRSMFLYDVERSQRLLEAASKKGTTAKPPRGEDVYCSSPFDYPHFDLLSFLACGC